MEPEKKRYRQEGSFVTYMIHYCKDPILGYLDAPTIVMLRLTCKKMRNFGRKQTDSSAPKLQTVELMLKHGYFKISCLMTSACYLREKNPAFVTSNAYSEEDEIYQKSILKEISEKKNWDEYKIDAKKKIFIEHAVDNNNLSLFKYLTKGSYTWLDFASRAAAKGFTEFLKYLKESGYCIGNRLMALAAESGNVETIKYLRGIGLNFNKRTISYAVIGGNLKMVKYLHESDCFWDEHACSRAALYGHLEILKYLHENGCPWCEATCSMACRMGHLECFKYANENGCPWNDFTALNAIQESRIEILKYIIETCHQKDEYIIMLCKRELSQPTK